MKNYITSFLLKTITNKYIMILKMIIHMKNIIKKIIKKMKIFKKIIKKLKKYLIYLLNIFNNNNNK
jgi:hypothetical protein